MGQEVPPVALLVSEQTILGWACLSGYCSPSQRGIREWVKGTWEGTHPRPRGEAAGGGWGPQTRPRVHTSVTLSSHQGSKHHYTVPAPRNRCHVPIFSGCSFRLEPPVGGVTGPDRPAGGGGGVCSICQQECRRTHAGTGLSPEENHWGVGACLGCGLGAQPSVPILSPPQQSRGVFFLAVVREPMGSTAVGTTGL